MADVIERQFHPTQTFTGIEFPRFDDKPDGPKLTSFAKCICGGWWKNHRFVDGACPLPPSTD